MRELDAKVKFEAYLREKRDAILEDRKQAVGPDGVPVDEAAADQLSHVERVKEKY